MSENNEISGRGEPAGLNLQIILDASPVGIIVFDQEARVLYANALAERLFGQEINARNRIQCGDFIGCANRGSAPKECGRTRQCPACPLFNAICGICSHESDRSVTEGEVFMDRDPGLSGLWVKYKVVPALIDGRRVVLMAIEDITEAKANEQDLHAALTELSVIHEHAPIAMMLVDRDRRVHKVNGFAAKFADRPAEEMIGMRGGEALRCLNHIDDPQGCGFGPACAGCRVLQAVLDTFETGTSREEVEAWLPFPRGGSTEERCFSPPRAWVRAPA